eukprot:TRINITY_DN2331_c0_g1_i1.p1 TRINITY_DN2331_c0_g1~~TRINITY_DN2331_c0_g1_i1.p1  ORF type:complete len:422 (-),score=85.65 TRINITY_DN2331_c0_g1_i1:147-1412(-)
MTMNTKKPLPNINSDSDPMSPGSMNARAQHEVIHLEQSAERRDEQAAAERQKQKEALQERLKHKKYTVKKAANAIRAAARLRRGIVVDCSSTIKLRQANIKLLQAELRAKLNETSSAGRDRELESITGTLLEAFDEAVNEMEKIPPVPSPRTSPAASPLQGAPAESPSPPPDLVDEGERERLGSILRFLGSDEVHQQLSDSLKYDHNVKAIAGLFPAQQFPTVNCHAHCVRCHQTYDPAYPAGCRVAHSQRNRQEERQEAWSMVFGEDLRKLEWGEQFHEEIFNDDRGSLWAMACCGESYHDSISEEEHSFTHGYCFDGDHTNDIEHVNYNGINVVHCLLDHAKEAFDEYASTVDAKKKCRTCGYPPLPRGQKCMCEFCKCHKIGKGQCTCGSHQKALEPSGIRRVIQCKVFDATEMLDEM